MKEIWKPISIKPLNKIYEISNKGRCRSKAHITTYTTSRGTYTRRFEGSLLKPFINPDGYKCIVLRLSKKKTTFRIGRLVAQAFIPNPDNKPQVNHINGNKLCDKVWNLEWNTNSENMLHAYKLGLEKGRKGEAHHRARFTEKQINKMRKLYKDGINVCKIAKLFDTSHQTISDIVHYKRWRHI